MKNIIFKEIAKINNFFVFHFNKINEFIKDINHKFKKISSFNKYLIFFITTLFLYLFYLSIPSLYDKGILQTKLNQMINKEYNINLSLSSDLSYTILPKPHIIIKNVKFFTNDRESPKELAQIKKLKVFISQKNFFDQKNLEIKKISFDQSNFLIQQQDLKYLKKFIEEKFSEKKININNSNFFYNDNKNKVISIFPVSNIDLFYDDQNNQNFLISKGELFTMPYTLTWSRNLYNNLNFSSLKINKLNIKIENLTEEKESHLLIKNVIFFRNTEIQTDIQAKKESIEISSIKDSRLVNNKLRYKGKIDFNPFHFVMNVDIEKLNFIKNIFLNDLIRSLFEMDQLYNENLSSKISINIEKLVKNKLFDSSKIQINLNNGTVNFNNTIFIGKIGILNLLNGSMENFKDEKIFNGNFELKINSKDEFYRLFQIAKKNKKKISNIYFDLEFNLEKNKFKITNLMFDPGKIKSEKNLLAFLNEYNDQSIEIDNWIDFKKFVNKIFSNYYEG